MHAVAPMRAAARRGGVRSFRIMSADRVPGVASTNTAPTHSKQPLGEEAASGAARLAAAVRKQKRDAARSREEAVALMSNNAAAASTAPPGSASASRLSAFTAALDTSIDGQALAKSVVARALRRRSLRLDDVERPLRMLFAGPSGVGKTAMATALCEALLSSRHRTLALTLDPRPRPRP